MSAADTLDDLAHRINVTLEKSENMRASAARLVADAKQRVESGEAGNVTWTDWCLTNLKTGDGQPRSLRDIRRLVHYGEQDDPQAAIDKDNREKQLERRLAGAQVNDCNKAPAGSAVTEPAALSKPSAGQVQQDDLVPEPGFAGSTIVEQLLELWAYASEEQRDAFLHHIGAVINPLPAVVQTPEPSPPANVAPAPATVHEQEDAIAATLPKLEQHKSPVTPGRRDRHEMRVETVEDTIAADDGGLFGQIKNWRPLDLKTFRAWLADGCPRHNLPASSTTAMGPARDTAEMCSPTQLQACIASIDAHLVESTGTMTLRIGR